jgi:uncharacterized repeat protein (TIGR03803 family)
MMSAKLSPSKSICSKTQIAILLFCALTAVTASAQTFNTLLSFNNSTGGRPDRPLVQGTDGNLYGGTSFGPGNYETGTVFSFTLSGTLTTLHTFFPHGINGGSPSGLVLANNGIFYGTSYYGGTNGVGTIFRIASAGQLGLLHTFGTTDGAYPSGPLIQATDGNFYGTTVNGGIDSDGTVFKMTPAGVLTTLYKFCSLTKCADGDLPFGPLLQAADGNFYGTTEGGGANNSGVAFKITPTGTFTAFYSFCSQSNCADGNGVDGLIQGADGNFYGVAKFGGANSAGTVFRLSPGGTLTTLYSFCSLTSCADGNEPAATLVQATDGDFYGTTTGGGTDTSCRCGTVFKITSSGSLTTLHSFVGTDGEFPSTGLLQATDGNFYGSSFEGGANGEGSIFSLSVGLAPFVALVQSSGNVGQTGGVLGQGFTGTTDVSINGTPAKFTVVSDTYLRVTVPAGATSGFVTVTTPTGVLTSNVVFQVR